MITNLTITVLCGVESVVLACKFAAQDPILSKPVDTSHEKISWTSRNVGLTKADLEIGVFAALFPCVVLSPASSVEDS